MLASLRARLTFANVASALALFVALSTGGAYAAHETIFSDDIVDGQVMNPDLGADSVSTAKIQTQGVANSDIAPNAITATRLATDSVETSEIKQGNVFNADIAGNTITSSRVAPDTLTDADLGPGSVGTSELADAPVYDMFVEVGGAVSVPAAGAVAQDVFAFCPNFETATGGGVRADGGTAPFDTYTLISRPTNNVGGEPVAGARPTGWFGRVVNRSATAAPPGDTTTAYAFVICVKKTP